MFETLETINARPPLYARYTAKTLWDDDHISKQMLAFHLNPDAEPASRNHAFLSRSVAWLIDRFDLGAGKRVADFGCGPGLYANALAGTGASVLGIDFSRRSVAHASERAAREGLAARYEVADYLSYGTGERFDLVTLIYCDLCALSPAQRGVLLSKFRDFLAPGGAVVLDVFSLAAYAARREEATYGHRLMNGFWAEGEYYGFLNTHRYEAEKVVLDRYTIVEPHRTREVYNWLGYFTPETLGEELAANGLAVEAILGNVAGDDYDEAEPQFALIARRA